MNDELPEGWEWSTIGQVADVQLGRQRSPQHHQGEQMRPYLRSANVTWNGISVEDVKEMNFDDADFEKYRLEAGDLLLNEASGSPNEVGKPAIWNGELEDCCFQNTLLRLRPRDVDRSYLYWYCYFSALTGRFGEAGRGVNIRHLGKRGLAQFPIPVAPCEDQKCIVEAIDEHLSRLNAASSTVDDAASRLGHLLDQALDSELCLGPHDRLRMSELITIPLTNGRSVPTAEQGGFPVLRLTCLRNGSVDTRETKLGDWGDEDPSRFLVETDDFLISRGNGSLRLVGRGGLVGDGPPPVTFPDTLIRARVDAGRIRPDFVRLVWHSRQVRRQIEAQAHTTAGIYKINQSMIERMEVPVPNLQRQREVVDRMVAVEVASNLLKTEIQHAASRSVSLRRAVLSAAFSGRLIREEAA